MKIQMNVSSDVPAEMRSPVVDGFVERIQDGSFEKVIGFSSSGMQEVLYFSNELYKKEVVDASNNIPSGHQAGNNNQAESV